MFANGRVYDFGRELSQILISKNKIMNKQIENKETVTKPELYTLLGAVTCGNCGTKDNYRNVTTDMIDLMEVERDRFCNNCDELMDSWAYGHWEKASDCT